MSRYRAVFVIPGLVVMMLMAAVVRPAGAGTIGLDGTLTLLSFTFSTIDLVGNRGFTAKGSSLAFVPVPAIGCVPCLPGDPLIVSGHAINSEDLFNTIVTLEGTTYRVGGLFSPERPSLDLTFTGPTLFAPPLNVAPIVALTTPVSVSGAFVHFGIVEHLAATATATVVLQRSDDCLPSGACWGGPRVTYDLAPTPEPTTLLLVGTGAAGAGLARWWKRRRVQAS